MKNKNFPNENDELKTNGNFGLVTLKSEINFMSHWHAFSILKQTCCFHHMPAAVSENENQFLQVEAAKTLHHR